MKDYLFLLLSALLLAVDFALNKLYQKRAGTSLSAGFRFNALLGLLTALIFWGMGGFSFRFSGFSIFMAGVMTLLAVSYTLLGFRILRAESMALYTMFLMTGGMLVPYVWGLVFLKEGFSPLRTLGLVLMIAAVVLSNMGEKKNNFRVLPLCVAVFFLNGFVSVISKLHQIETALPTVSATEFVMLSGIFKFLLAGAAFLIAALLEKRKKTEEPRPKIRLRSILPIILCSAILGGVSYTLQLLGAENLPATVLYPFVTGGSMLLSTLTGMLIFREKPSRRVILGVCLCFLGTLMFL